MSANEGLSRIASVVRGLSRWGGAMVALSGVALLGYSNSLDSDVVGGAVILFVIGGLVAGAGHALAWIIEGFAASR